MSRIRLALVVVAGGATLLVLRYGREMPWLLASVVAVAVGVLVWTGVSTVDRLRGIWRRR